MDWKFQSGKILVARLMSWNVIGRKYSLDEIRETHEYAEQ